MKSWLAQGSSGRRVILLPGTTFLHINGALEKAGEEHIFGLLVDGPITRGAWKRQLTLCLFAFITGDFLTKLWRRRDHGYVHTSYEPKRDNELHLTKGQRVKDIVKVADTGGWYEVRNRMTQT